MRTAKTIALGLALATPALAAAKPAAHPAAEAQALDIAKRAIAFRTVAGPGNQTPQLAAYLKDELVAGGFADGDVTITPVDDTAYLVARWPGSDPSGQAAGHLGPYRRGRGQARRLAARSVHRRWSRTAISTAAARPT